MSFSRSFDASGSGAADQTRRLTVVHEHKRRSTAARTIGVGTLACARCDAPVAIAGPYAPAEMLSCPFCAHRAPLRDFLSLAAPARPARVVIRLRAAHRSSGG